MASNTYNSVGVRTAAPVMEPRATRVHNGTEPAGAMITPFAFPCGTDFLVEHADPKCAPPGFEKYWWSSAGYYSPAICPTGYTVGCLRWHSDQGPPLEPTETAGQCVPSQTAPMIQIRWATDDMSNFATHSLYPGANPTDHDVAGEANQPIYTAGAVVARQVSSGIGGGDFPTDDPFDSYSFDLPTQFSTDSNGDIVLPTSGRDPVGGSSDGNGSDDDFNKSISTAAKAGIGVGVSLGVLSLIGVIVLLVFFHRKKKKRNAANSVGVVPGAPQNQQGPDMAQTQSQYGGTTWANSPAPPSGVNAEFDTRNPSHPEMDTNSHSPNPVGVKPELGSQTPLPVELHQETQIPRSQVSPTPVELDGSGYQSTGGPISRKQVASPSSASTPYPTSSPSNDTGLAMPPPAVTAPGPQTSFVTQISSDPSPEEINSLRDQHAMLETRRQRLLELEQIEREKAALQQRMGSGGQAQQ